MTPENPTEKLEPCPFCQSHDMYVRKIGTHGESNAVRCRGCGCHGPLRATPADALVSWNTHPPLAASETPPDERAVMDEIDLEAMDAQMRLQNKEMAATAALAKTDWHPSRSHLEGMRNTMREALESLATIRALLTQPEPSPDEHPANSAGQGDEQKRQPRPHSGPRGAILEADQTPLDNEPKVTVRYPRGPIATRKTGVTYD